MPPAQLSSYVAERVSRVTEGLRETFKPSHYGPLRPGDHAVYGHSTVAQMRGTVPPAAAFIAGICTH